MQLGGVGGVGSKTGWAGTTADALRTESPQAVGRRGYGPAMKRPILAVLAALAFIVAPTAHADPEGNATCRLLAAGNTPDWLANSVTVHQVLGPDATDATARLYVRTVVTGQCPQILWWF